MGKSGRNKKIGLLGGSFNPAHEGHLYISQKAIELLALDEVWWILSPQNPLKDKRTIWPYEERLETVNQLIHDQPNIIVSEVESAIGSQYTVDTLAHLTKEHPNIQFVWLMGEDNLYNFHRWHRWQEIAKTMPIAVLAREVKIKESEHDGLLSPTYTSQQVSAKDAATLVEKKAPAWIFLPIKHHPLSSTAIRERY